MKIRDSHVSFRVYPEKNRKFYYLAFVFRSNALMYEHFDLSNAEMEWSKGANRTNGKFDAITESWVSTNYSGKPGRPRRGRCVGQILFYAGSVGSGVVSHEMSHAALHFSEKQRKVDAATLYDLNPQEKFCWIQGYLVAQFWRRFFAVQPKVEWLKGV